MTRPGVIGAAAVALALAACSAPPESAPPTARKDAGAAVDAAAKSPPTGGSANGYHLDPDPSSSYQRPSRHGRTRGRPVELVIRSTPPGAMASINGKPIGTTPTYWDGVVNGEAQEFTFTLPGYAVARYRFVPTTNGTVHGTLTRLVTAIDAGPSN